MRYRPERAVLPDGSVRWVVIDNEYELHDEASAFLRGIVELRDRSIGTARVYAGRVALFDMANLGVGVSVINVKIWERV